MEQVRQLSGKEAARGYPVRLRGVVTFFDPGNRFLTVQDATAGVPVDAFSMDSGQLTQGLEVDIDGWTGVDAFAPMVVKPRIEIRGVSEMPAAKLAPLEQVTTGGLDFQWVEVRGTITSIAGVDNTHVRLGLKSGQQSIDVHLSTEIYINRAIQGTEVRVRGVPSTFHDLDGRARKARLYVPDARKIDASGIELASRPVAPNRAGSPAKVLTTAREVKQLTPGEAARSYRIKLRGVVNHFIPLYGGLFIQDATGGIYVSVLDGVRPTSQTGSEVEVEGRSDPGDFAPSVADASVKVLGKGRMFAPFVVRNPDDLVVTDENRWARMEGTARRITPWRGYGVQVDFGVAGRPFRFTVSGEEQAERYAGWIDAELAVEGILSPQYDRFRRLMGFVMVSPGAQFVRVTKTAPKDLFAGPPQPLVSLQQYQFGGAPGHRVKVAGTVTSVWRDSSVHISDGKFGMELRGNREYRLEVGDLVEAVGFPRLGGPEPGLEWVELRKMGRGIPEKPQDLDAEVGLAGADEARLIRVEGLLLNRESIHGEEILTMEAGKTGFTGIIEQPQPSARVSNLKNGSMLRVTGVCLVDWDRSRMPPERRGLRIRLRTPEDIEVLQEAPWWTVQRTLSVLAGVALFLMGALAWAFSLSSRVRRQTTVIAARAEHAAQLEAQLAHSQRLESVGRMAGGIAHDFNNLLTVINGYSELLQREPGMSKAARFGLAEIAKAGGRAASLTQQMLAFGRRQMLLPVVLDLNEVVREVARMLKRAVGERIELATNLEPQLGLVRADSGQMHQVLMNLVVNARDAMPSGGKLVVETANREVTEAFWEEDGEVRPGSFVSVSVSDTGTGMDEATLKRIYEPFFTTKPVGEGTGLGLSMVFGIVKQSGGHLRVESQVGQGSTFEVLLPRVHREAEAATETAERAATGDETVLVVEDQPEVRGMVRTILQSAGYRVLEAEHGEKALEVCRVYRARIDLLLSDIVMPGMNGGELARLLHGTRTNLRVLLMSGYSGQAMAGQAIVPEDTAYIQKPFSPNALLGKVRAVLDSSDAS